MRDFRGRRGREMFTAWGWPHPHPAEAAAAGTVAACTPLLPPPPPAKGTDAQGLARLQPTFERTVGN